jgi:hypothetical protein
MLFQVLTAPLPSWPRRLTVTSPHPAYQRRSVGAAKNRGCAVCTPIVLAVVAVVVLLVSNRDGVVWLRKRRPGTFAAAWCGGAADLPGFNAVSALAAPLRRGAGLVGSLRLRNGSSAGEVRLLGRGGDTNEVPSEWSGYLLVLPHITTSGTVRYAASVWFVSKRPPVDSVDRHPAIAALPDGSPTDFAQP